MLNGKPVSKGVALAKALLYLPSVGEISAEKVPEGLRGGQVEAFYAARETAKAELNALAQSLAGTEEAKIFAAHEEILFDVAIEEEVKNRALTEGQSAAYAVDSACSEMADMLAEMDDPLFAERSADILDVKNRLVRILTGAGKMDLSHLPEDVVIVAEDLLPSDTAGLDKARVAAIVTEKGGETSHSAIIARKNRIPALAGVQDATKIIRDGQLLLVDAMAGTLIVDPDAAERAAYEAARAAFYADAAETDKFLSAQPLMKDGTRIPLCLNIASADDEELAGAKYADGVGLLRTEFFYMNCAELPSEERQFQAYKKALEAFGKKEVILRTLDIGGDKQVDCMDLPKEDNPFLGLRALRLCFERPDIFKTQLRAALRAAEFGTLSIMLPMISSIEEIRRARAMAEEAAAELKAAGKCVAPYKFGIMIEIPSIALIADAVAREVDFASFGTNDLCQYLLAVDRLNPAVSAYYEKYHPAMFRLMGYAAGQFAEAGKPISVCGELGGDALAAPVLLGLGVTKLSMNISSLAVIKRTLSKLTMADCRALAKEVLTQPTAQDVEKLLRSRLA